MAHHVISPILVEDLNKFKVVHTLNTAGQTTLLTVYQYFKRFPNTKSIKEHLIEDLGINDHEYIDSFDGTMRRVIENTAASGEAYDISLLIKFLKNLSGYYERDNKRRWNNKNELEFRCKKLAEMRNKAFHSFSGLNKLEMLNEINAIKLLINDIFDSLKKRFPKKNTEISKKNKDIAENIEDILAQPLGEIEIKTYLCHKYLRDEIPSYKNSCKNWGKIKILDFLLASNNLHDIKLLFTEVIIEKSNRFNKNMPVNCTDIINLLSESNLLLLDSEAGGGKSTIFLYTIADWGEGGKEMKTSGYDIIIPMVFLDPDLCSVADLISELIPKLRTKMSNDDIMNCLADSSFNILFLCDGYDERNDNSDKLFREICKLKVKHKHIKVIVTSRPESVKDLYTKKCSKLIIDHLKVRGIHESKRCEFLKKYHDELVNAGISKESTEDLITFFENCSAHHKDLYRLPLNLVILTWLWGQAPQLVKTIKSAAGLYTAILDIQNEKLVSRIVNSHPNVMNHIKDDRDELNNLICHFKEVIFNESLVALRSNRIFIDDMGVKCLKDVCTDKGLPFLELQGAYLLLNLEWHIKLVEILQIPHKGFLDFYAAKCIESKLSQGGKRIKNILLEDSNADNNIDESNKYQNVLQLLGGILALKDPLLVEEHGQDIINLLIETGISNNTQWYAVYSDLNINPEAAKDFGYLIAPKLDLNNFSIKDADVEVLSTLLQYVNIDTVTLDISSTDMLPQLPTLLNVLRSKNCIIKISNIIDSQVGLWNFSITKNTKINIDKVIIKNEERNLPFLSYCNSIDECILRNLWWELDSSAPNMSSCQIRMLWTAVYSTEALPTTVKYLSLGLLEDQTIGVVKDPGLAQLTQRCTLLTELGVHVRAGMVTEHLPQLPDVEYINLNLSRLNNDHHLQWAIDTALKLQPARSGYWGLTLPSCGLQPEQLYELVIQLAASGVTVYNRVCVSSRHTNDEQNHLEDAINAAFSCALFWYQDDEDLSSGMRSDTSTRPITSSGTKCSLF
ncbi:unnamed protein product [Meganyctiphanes norvegica]|uniref:NACHT domain-containing protein n=1 Tax=Meganyctiphanes norvegica TaxID=48144 RepID=A0AAV2SM36_MEGNR